MTRVTNPIVFCMNEKDWFIEFLSGAFLKYSLLSSVFIYHDPGPKKLFSERYFEYISSSFSDNTFSSRGIFGAIPSFKPSVIFSHMQFGHVCLKSLYFHF